MPIHQKTLEIYEKEKFQYHRDSEDKAYQDWLGKVTNISTGEPIQPIREIVTRIYRIKSSDDKEYIAWKGYWVGVDSLGNELYYNVGAKGAQLTYIKPILKRKVIYDRRTDRTTTGSAEEIGREIAYEREFSPEAVEELLKKAKNPSMIQLTVYKDFWPGQGGKSQPIAVPPYEIDRFMHEDFNTLCKVDPAAYLNRQNGAPIRKDSNTQQQSQEPKKSNNKLETR